MLKKEITYEDLDGNPVTEAFYFHMTPAQITEFEMEYGGGVDLPTFLRKIAGTSEAGKVVPLFRALIAATVGKRGADNKQFIKDEETRNAFMNSDAYSVLYLELLQNPMVAAEFINGIIPASLAKRAGGNLTAQMQKLVEEFSDGGPKMTDVVNTASGITIKEVSLDTVGMPHTYAEVVSATGDIKGITMQGQMVSDTAVMETAIVEAEKHSSLKGVTSMGQIVDETTANPDEVPAKSVHDFTRNELLAMDDDTFHGLVGTDATKWTKAILGIAMQRRASSE